MAQGKAPGEPKCDHGKREDKEDKEDKKEDNSASSSTTKVQSSALGKQTRVISESAGLSGGRELRRSSRLVNNRDNRLHGAPEWDGITGEHPAGSLPASSSHPIDLLEGTATEARDPPQKRCKGGPNR